jgi:hypothetical protein
MYFYRLVLLFILTLSFKATACDHLMRSYEVKYNIPQNLLKAISHVESGHMTPSGVLQSGLYVINASGRAYRFNTKQEAIDKVLELKRQGINSIDVGCMQINLKHHPDAFKNLDEAFDAHKNVDYAAKYLISLKKSHGSWGEAVGRYHSSSDFHKRKYHTLVQTRLKSLEGAHSPVMTVFQKPTRVHSYEQEAQKTQDQVVHTSLTTQNGQDVPVQIKFAPFKLAHLQRPHRGSNTNSGPMKLREGKVFPIKRQALQVKPTTVVKKNFRMGHVPKRHTPAMIPVR